MSDRYETAAESAAKVRAALKKELGYGPRDVSVRCDNYSMGSAVRVRIKRVGLNFAKIKEIAEREESIRRCEYSGEILSGGNRYVTVDFSRECEDVLVAQFLPIVEAAPVVGKNTWTEIEGFEGGLIRRHPNDRYEVSVGDYRNQWAGDAKQAAFLIAWAALRRHPRMIDGNFVVSKEST